MPKLYLFATTAHIILRTTTSFAGKTNSVLSLLSRFANTALQVVVFLVSFTHKKSKHQKSSTYTQPGYLEVFRSQQPLSKKPCYNPYQFISSLHGSVKESRVQKCWRITKDNVKKNRVEVHIYCSLTDFR